MSRRVFKVGFSVFLLLAGTLPTSALFAQTPGSGSLSGAPADEPTPTFLPMVDLDVYVKGANGSAIEAAAVVTLTNLNGKVFVQGTTKAGYVRFNRLPSTEFMLQVVAPAYETATKRIDTETHDTLLKVTIELRPPSNLPEGLKKKVNGEAGLFPAGPKEQQKLQLTLVKALKLLGPLMSSEQKELARNHLEEAYKIAPASGDVNYLFGAYWWQAGDRERAKSFWTKATEYEPEHFRALLSLGQALLDDHKAEEALPYLERAAQAKPFSWRTYALSADAYLRQGSLDQAVKQAERALELGHEEAALAQRYLAAALAKLGEKDKAVSILQSYVQSHRADISAKKQLEKLQATEAWNVQDADAASEELLQSEAVGLITPVPLLDPAWLPPDVDEKVPPVEQRAACALEDVVQKAGKQAQAFVKNVEHFTANEFLEHESIDKWGMAGSPETRKFDYVVAIEELRPGFLGVEEYRSSHSSDSEFPGGVATNGLPALMLIFHPYNSIDFEMTCEGLTRWNGKPAWQVHFRQRRDRPNTMRAYRLGMDGPTYPVALKGRAWILADSYQVARLETDLIAPVPEIKLFADRTVIEYAPVRFKKGNVEMWLPQSAEVFYDWRGKRIHRRHSFSNYLLFAVDEKQRISAPKVADESPSNPPKK